MYKDFILPDNSRPLASEIVSRDAWQCSARHFSNFSCNTFLALKFTARELTFDFYSSYSNKLLKRLFYYWQTRVTALSVARQNHVSVYSTSLRKKLLL
jgi:hypothetical protein